MVGAMTPADTRAEAAQKEIVTFLKRRDAYGAGPVSHIITHAAHVFMAGDQAFKLKRAVTYGFLDFSTIEKRRWALKRELELNRRLAPDIYLDVMPVTKSAGKLVLGGNGAPLDWVLVMRRFDQADIFDKMAMEDRITPALINGLGDDIAAFHKSLPPVEGKGGAARMRKSTTDVFAALEPCVGHVLTRSAVDAARESLKRTVEDVSAILDRRRDQGFVRYCHGDMHLANICLWKGRATPFDCIEFNDDIACCDLLHDLAFPVMDLVAYQARPLANLLMNRYLEATQDYGDLEVLPFFLAARAIIRAMATGLVTDKRAPAKVEMPQRYIRLITEFLTPSAPRLIGVGGLSGSGKSMLARELAVAVAGGAGAIIVRSDGIRKRMAGKRPEEKLGPESYSKDMNAAVYDRMKANALNALKAGQSVIVDAAHLRAAERDALSHIATVADAPFTGLWLDVPPEITRARISARVGDASDAGLSVLERQMHYDLEPIRWRRINAGGQLKTTLEQALDLIFP